MPYQTIQIVAPSRLHFGLLSFGAPSQCQFGGVGAMLETPGVRVGIHPANQLHASGCHAPRTIEFARRWTLFHHLPAEPACHIDVVAAPRQHIGLGVGTQLAMSVAAGLIAFCRLPMPSPPELAISVDRGRRSAVGTYGFAQGGLVADGGKMPGDAISPLHFRWDVPSDWRFVLTCPRRAVGVFGPAEEQAFERLSSVPDEMSQRLQREIRDCLMPSLVQKQFNEFSESVYRYGRLAGQCFAAWQGGPYNGPELTKIVETIRAMGVRGVGQSSWGPTLFALLPNEDHAKDFANQLSRRYRPEEHDIWISMPNNHGARVNVLQRAVSERSP